MCCPCNVVVHLLPDVDVNVCALYCCSGSRFSGLGNVNTLGSTNSAQTNTGNTRPEEKKETTHFPGAPCLVDVAVLMHLNVMVLLVFAESGSGHTLGGGGGSSSVSRETLQKQRLAALGVTNV